MHPTLTAADAQAFAKLRDLINDIHIAMITTVGIDGALHSRPMATREMDPEGTIWFFTSDDSLKAREISEEHEVNVSYAEPKTQRYVSVSGTATLERDAARAARIWHPSMKTYFPAGADDPHLVLLRVRIESAEYWDAPNNRMVQFYAFARSMITGDPPQQIGDHRHVDLPGFVSRK